MTFHLPKLYAITDTRMSGLSHSEQVSRLAAGGATLIQIRDKVLPSRAFFEEATLALRTARRLGVKLIINDRVDIALALQADGVHLGQTDIPAEDARKLLGPQVLIGVSVHNAQQAEKVLDSPVDYVAAGPVFPTSSKANPDPVLGLEGLKQIRQIVANVPLVAIGGIDLGNAAQVCERGADSVAVIRGLLSAPDTIEQATARFLSLLGQQIP